LPKIGTRNVAGPKEKASHLKIKLLALKSNEPRKMEMRIKRTSWKVLGHSPGEDRPENTFPPTALSSG